MANRRCFSMAIVDSDAFLDMPSSAQNLYFHIGMRSDDDGFCASPMKIIKIVNASNDDLKLLIAKKFLLECNNGVVVVKHWWIHNTMRKDTYKPSNYLPDNPELKLDTNKAYTFNENGIPLPNRYRTVNEPLPQIKLKETKLNKDNLIEDNLNQDKEELIDSNKGNDAHLHTFTEPLVNRLIEVGYMDKGSMEDVEITNLVIDKLLKEGHEPLSLSNKVKAFIEHIKSVDEDEIENKANYLKDYLTDDDNLPF